MSKKPITDALCRLLARPSEGDPSRTNADLVAQQWLQAILGGSRRALLELLARLPDDEAEELTDLIAARLRADATAPTS